MSTPHSTLSRWEVTSENHKGMFARQALSLVWDYSEAITTGDRVGSWASLLSGQFRPLNTVVVSDRASVVLQESATRSRSSIQAVVTDPPYYNAIDYAGLSDFFFVWLKRSIGFLHPELLSMPHA